MVDDNNVDEIVETMCERLGWEAPKRQKKGYILQDTGPTHYLDSKVDQRTRGSYIGYDPTPKRMYESIRSGDLSLKGVDVALQEILTNAQS